MVGVIGRMWARFRWGADTRPLRLSQKGVARAIELGWRP